MSSKGKHNFKQFTISTLEDGIMALGSLIVGVVVNLKKYKEYESELEKLLEKYSELSNSGSADILIPANEYDNINDKLLYRQREILKFVADCQKSSFSYLDFRKYLVKTKLLDSTLDEETTKILNEFLDIRNWTFHNPQSMMVANAEVAKKKIPKELQGLVKIQPQLNPLIITHTENYDLAMLITLYIHVNKRIEQFELVLSKMKSDYDEMYQKVKYKPVYLVGPKDTSKAIFYERYETNRLNNHSSDVTQISMAIQKSKYDGSTKSFNQWAINKTENDEGISKKGESE